MTLTRRTFVGSGAALAAGLPSSSMAANDRIQIGMIGAGARAHELIQGLVSMPGVEVVALVDAYRGRIERAIERTKGRAKAYPSYPDLLAQKSIDAVVVATPDHWHRQIALDALRAGKDVYCEKPLTYRSSEGPEIVAAVRASGRIFQVGSDGMSSPLQVRAREMIQSGKLGKVTIVRAAYNRNTASGAWIYPIPPDASPQTVDWEMFLGPAPKRPFSLERFFRWRCYEDYSGGIATDLFVHLLTTIHFLMDAKAPSSVMAMGQLYRRKESREVPDTLNAVLEYPEGFVVNLSSTFNNQTGNEAGFQFLGTEGGLALGGNLYFYPEVAVEDNRWIVDSWPRALADAYYRDPKIREIELPQTRQPKLIDGPAQFRQEGLDATISHLANWVQSLRTRKPYWEDALAGHHAAAGAHMINLSARQRRLVEWDFARDDIKA
ncbi:MAG: Gfo/Idh/MocA family oxidoreductase [Bryobacteraceae bacterium]|jgi:predicted dehydrogenase